MRHPKCVASTSDEPGDEAGVSWSLRMTGGSLRTAGRGRGFPRVRFAPLPKGRGGFHLRGANRMNQAPVPKRAVATLVPLPVEGRYPGMDRTAGPAPRPPVPPTRGRSAARRRFVDPTTCERDTPSPRWSSCRRCRTTSSERPDVPDLERGPRGAPGPRLREGRPDAGRRPTSPPGRGIPTRRRGKMHRPEPHRPTPGLTRGAETAYRDPNPFVGKRFRSTARPPRSHDRTHAIRPQPDRLPAHRRGADGPVQLAAGPAPRRPVHPPDRRHRPAAARRGRRPADPRRLPLDGDGLGRRPRGRRPARPLLPVAARPTTTRRPPTQLVASGHVYRDYSTEAERAADKRDAAEARKVAYRFRRTPIADDDLARFEAEGRPFALRFRGPARPRSLVVHDLIKGDVEQKTDEIGDFVIVRPDGTPLYNFASVVDDVDDGDHPRRPRRGAPLEHLPAAPGLRGPGATLPRVRPRPLRRRAGLEGEALEAKTEITRSAASWSTCTSTSRRATCPRPC